MSNGEGSAGGRLARVTAGLSRARRRPLHKRGMRRLRFVPSSASGSIPAEVVLAEQPASVPTGAVLANPKFLALFLSQVLTQVGGNMVLYGLTVQVFNLTGSSTSVSVLLLTFLVPAVVFGAVAGVYSDQFDRRLILVFANVARGLLFLVLVFLDENLFVLYLFTATIATLTTFFGPAEAAMIPQVVHRDQLMSANALFVFTLQASFVVGFAVLGPLFQTVVGTDALIAIVAGFYLLAAVMCWLLPPSPAPERLERGLGMVHSAIRATFDQLREGIWYIRTHRRIFWSLTYLTITASLIGVLGVLGPGFAVKVLGLNPNDFVVIVLPLGAGLVVGILALNAYGRYVRRRRLIEGGLITLGISLTILGLAQRVTFIANGSGALSLLSVVMAVAFVAGVAYAFVAIPAQTRLQEELPSEVRGRVFGVLNMLVSLASFLPIIVVGTVADLVGTSAVIVVAALVVIGTGIASILLPQPAAPAPAEGLHLEPVDPISVTSTSSTLVRPIRLRYLDEEEVGSPIQYLSSPVDSARATTARDAGRGGAGGTPSLAKPGAPLRPLRRPRRAATSHDGRRPPAGPPPGTS